MPSPTTRQKYVPPSQRFSDVTPLPQDDPESSLVVIDYEPIFAEIHSYFRAFYVNKEYSERGLDLSEETIECNAANYTAWWYRRKCLVALNYDLREELNTFSKFWLERSSKNYQVWYHRKWLIERVGDAEIAKEELGLMRELLFGDDHKIYNVWSHRLFLLRTFFGTEAGVLRKEMDYSEEMLQRDVWNNSAWNHRYTIRKMLQAAGACPSASSDVQSQKDAALEELRFVKAHLCSAERNEAAWNYLTALVEDDFREILEPHSTVAEEADQGEPPSPRVGKFLAMELVDFFSSSASSPAGAAASPPSPASQLDSGALNPFVLQFEAHFYLVLARTAVARGVAKLEERLQRGLRVALQHFKTLEVIDPIRMNFWVWKQNWLQKEFKEYSLGP